MPIDIATALSAEAAKRGVGKLIEILNSHLSTTFLKHRTKKIKLDSESVLRNMDHVRKVKSILSLEESLDLVDFYYPTKIYNSKDKRSGIQTKVVHDLRDFPGDQKVLLTGTVGQGKSIFMRYLALGELVRGERIPLFFELRKIQDGQHLEGCLQAELQNMGFDVDTQIFQLLANIGMLTLFLDGLDEVHAENRPIVISEVEGMVHRYSKLNVFLSSRPNTGAEGSPSFKTYRLATLNPGEYKDVIQVMVRDEDKRKSLARALETSLVKEILNTPLMVALMVVRYRIEETVPESEIGFFSDLFDLLVRRHDRWKSGYTRPRKSSIGDSKLHTVFEGICFFSNKNNLTGEFTRRQLVEQAAQSMRTNDITGEVDDIVDDISEVTNLVIDDGTHCKFAHRSIQEYYAASFISNRSQANAKSFYSSVLHKWQNWNEELHYLASLDRHRYLRFFSIPGKAQMLGLDSANMPEAWHSSNRDFEVIMHNSVSEDTNLKEAISMGGSFFLQNHFALRLLAGFEWRGTSLYEITELGYEIAASGTQVKILSLSLLVNRNTQSSSESLKHSMSVEEGFRRVKNNSKAFWACLKDCNKVCQNLFSSLVDDINELRRLEASNELFSV